MTPPPLMPEAPPAIETSDLLASDDIPLPPRPRPKPTRPGSSDVI